MIERWDYIDFRIVSFLSRARKRKLHYPRGAWKHRLDVLTLWEASKVRCDLSMRHHCFMSQYGHLSGRVGSTVYSPMSVSINFDERREWNVAIAVRGLLSANRPNVDIMYWKCSNRMVRFISSARPSDIKVAEKPSPLRKSACSWERCAGTRSTRTALP